MWLHRSFRRTHLPSYSYSVTTRNYYPSLRRWASTEKHVKVPLNVYSLEGRYATALYTAAMKTSGSSLLESIERDLLSIQSIIQKTPSLAQFLKDPTLKSDLKKKQLVSVWSKALQEKSTNRDKEKEKLLSNLVDIMAENARLPLLSRIIDAFEEIMKAHRKEIDVIIITAMEMDAAYMKKLTEKLIRQFVPEGQTPSIQTKVDPSLLGGLLVSIGDKTIDLSVSSKVNKINHLLNDTI